MMNIGVFININICYESLFLYKCLCEKNVNVNKSIYYRIFMLNMH